MRREIPGVTLRTSFIVGFPGETQADFDVLCDFVREAQFDWLGVFGYSDEQGSPSFALSAKVAPKEIEHRRKKLMSIQKQISRKKKRALIGQQFDLLLEGPSEETELLWQARTAMHAPEIDGTVYVNDFGDQRRARRRISSLRDHRSPRLRSRGPHPLGQPMAKKKRTVSLRCPTCKKIVLANDPDFPFCSERCRVIDLGKWASGAYVISAPLNDPEDRRLHLPGRTCQKAQLKSTAPVRSAPAWATLVATFFGAGRLRPGPGTWGSLAAALLWWLLASQLPASARRCP